MLYRVVHEEPQLHGVPDALAPLLHACLAKDPEERPSTLQLSLRLKEIAAREAHGHQVLDPHGQPDRPVDWRGEEPAQQRTERRPGTAPVPRTTPLGSRGGPGTGSRSTGARSAGARPAGRAPIDRTHTRPLPGTARPPARTVRVTSTGRRPAGTDRRLLRQRLIVFVVVTLLAALGIAAAQGCQGPAQGLDMSPRAPYGTTVAEHRPFR